MKKIFIIAAAIVAMVSCNKNDKSLEIVTMPDNAVGFSAYTSAAVTKGEVVEKDQVLGEGIGVFAFYQPATGGVPSMFNTRKYAIPDFMYNQNVKPNVEQELTEADAIAYNANLSDAVAVGDVQVEEVLYTDETAAAHNATLPGAAKEGYIITAVHNAAVPSLEIGKIFTAEQAIEYNATLPGAVKKDDEQVAKVLYTDETAAAHNATLPGAVKAGKIYGDIWSYSPLKYWPNNEGDMVSFFAYAPYVETKTWEDLGIKTDINATKMTVSFPVYDEVFDQVDYLWADPKVNQEKPAVDAKVAFEFNHIMSQINLFAAAETDAKAKNPNAWTDANTTITINKVVFKNLAESVDIEYAFDPFAGTTTISGNQDIVLTDSKDFENNTSAAWADGVFKQFNKKTSVMFVAPQALSDVIITYTVDTPDSSNEANHSTITNEITASLSGLTLEAGNSYKLNFLIGMTSVKFTVTVNDWATPVIVKQLDVPANK